MAHGRSRLARDWLSVALFGLCVVVAVIDFPLLGLSVGFGPDGFGGDANPSRSQVAAYHRGQVAGVVALLIPVVSAAAFLAIDARSRRQVVIAVVVVSQLAAFTWFWVAAVR
jgi:hypothetical protein